MDTPTPDEIATLRTLTNPAQFETIAHAMLNEEGDHFIEIIDRIHATWQAMPATYATESQGESAVEHLHYFLGGADWWLIEKDADTDHAGQIQAFGIAELGMGPELGYISISELLENGAELDSYYAQQTVAEILGRCIA